MLFPPAVPIPDLSALNSLQNSMAWNEELKKKKKSKGKRINPLFIFTPTTFNPGVKQILRAQWLCLLADYYSTYLSSACQVLGITRTLGDQLRKDHFLCAVALGSMVRPIYTPSPSHQTPDSSPGQRPWHVLWPLLETVLLCSDLPVKHLFTLLILSPVVTAWVSYKGRSLMLWKTLKDLPQKLNFKLRLPYSTEQTRFEGIKNYNYPPPPQRDDNQLEWR